MNVSAREKVISDMKEALKRGEKARLSVLRMFVAAMKNKEIELRRGLDDGEVAQVAATLIRQRTDSVVQYRRGGRDDLADREEAEIAVLRAYLPEQLSASELEEVVASAVEELGASDMKDMGRVMKSVMEKVRGRADGRVVSETVRKALSR
ncbi:MAG TPA: GatB/YqeY domain-containing protein [Deltaproteobacteria bacterium]|nr:GatB/YqeY domain-containing protein [Deltaproteobacteria bacterium]